MKQFGWKKVIVILLLVILVAVMTVFAYLSHNYRNEVFVEAGDSLEVSDIWNGIYEASLVGEAVDTTVPGEYRRAVKLLNLLQLPVTITVKDTVVPHAVTQDLVRRKGESCTPEDFIVSVDDKTDVVFAFEAQPDMELMGTQQVTIIVTDEGNNKDIVKANLFIPSVKESADMEVGEEVPGAEVYLESENSTASYITDLSTIDTAKLGSHTLSILVDEMEYEVTLNVIDTTAPTGTLQDLTDWTNKPFAVERFVIATEDMTAVTPSYQTEPDWTKEGEQTVSVRLTDEAGNTAVLEAKLTLEADTVAPVINAGNISVKVGKNISYKKAITVTDNCDLPEDVELKIDSSAVNLKQVGEYKVICTAVDTAGNEAQKEITVQVVPEQVLTYEQAEIDQMADAVLAKIITPDMTIEQKCRAIFDWVKKNVSYINNSEKGNWLRGAYEGFKLHKGDCYVYYATSRALLTRAGIPNLEIKKEKQDWTSQSNHYWNLVDIGGGWYHFDTTPRKDKTVFYMWTDAQLLEYSNSHKGSHNFTRELYPAIN